MDIHSNFQTPPAVCEYMAGMIPSWVETILEPTPGLGNLVNAVKAARPKAKITAPADFFLLGEGDFNCVIMNPPFSSKYAKMEHAPGDLTEKGMRLGYYMLTECMRRSDHFIALMPWFTISDSDVRLRHLKEWGIKSITALPRKTFQYARTQTCVLELEFGYTQDTIFKTFKF